MTYEIDEKLVLKFEKELEEKLIEKYQKKFPNFSKEYIIEQLKLDQKFGKLFCSWCGERTFFLHKAIGEFGHIKEHKVCSNCIDLVNWCDEAIEKDET